MVPAVAALLLAGAAVRYWRWTCRASYQIRRILASAPIEAALVQGEDVSSYVRALVAVGRFGEARRIARRVPDFALRSTVLNHVAEALAKAGMIRDAASTAQEVLNVAQQILVNLGRSSALISVAFALATAGNWAEAGNLAQQEPYAPSRDAALSSRRWGARPSG